MHKKKVFKNNRINKVTMLQNLTWLMIPLLMLIGCLINRDAIIEVVEAGELTLGSAIFLVTCSSLGLLIVGLIPFIGLRVYLRSYKKQIIRNSSFITIADFDYYRDKLSGLSAGLISLISDLKIEQGKDVSASLLKYQEMGIIRQNGSNWYPTDSYTTEGLRPSDKYLLESILNHKFDIATDTQWQKLVKEEAVNEGYIREWGFKEKKNDAHRKLAGCCLGGCIMPFVFFIIICVLIYNGASDINALDPMLEQDLSNIELIRYMNQNQHVYWVLSEWVLIVVMMIAIVGSVIWSIIKFVATEKGAEYIKRTDYGNEMAECIFGMKNFIHDFSNLSEAEREHVVLWNDYLIYAKVMEETRKF